MKLNKKFLSCFMAATMMVSPATVFAADTVDVASGTVNGSGTVHYVNTQVYNIILPTDKALDFHIDPYGLLSMTTPDITVSDALSNAAAAATNITSNATAVINKSSVPVNVAVEAMVHNGNTVNPVDTANASAAAVKLVDDPSKVKEASDASYAGVYLAITPINGASITSLTTGPASDVADLTLNAVNVANKTVTGAVFTLSDASFNLTNSTLLSDKAYAITSNGDAANPTKFDIDLKGMPEAYKITSTASVAVLDENISGSILANAVSASAVSFMFNITGKVDYTSPVWQEFDPDQNVNGQQKIELQVKFIITKGEDVPVYDDGDKIVFDSSKNSITFKSTFSNVTDVFMTSQYLLGNTKINGNTITISKDDDDIAKSFLTTPGTYTMYVYSGSQYHTLTFETQ